MSLQQITITFLTFTSASPSVMSTASVSIGVSAGLQSLDSGQTVSTQTGSTAFDLLVAAIAKRGGFIYTDVNGIQNFIPINQITKILGE